MTRLVVADASALVALLLDEGPDGRWAETQLTGTRPTAPSLVQFEVANIIRRHLLADLISGDQAAQAHADLLDLAVELWPYELLASRAWELRDNLTAYDASYVALAELIDTPLLTLDQRIANAPGPTCEIRVPRPSKS